MSYKTELNQLRWDTQNKRVVAVWDQVLQTLEKKYGYLDLHSTQS